MNNWGIPDWLEKEVRERDKACVYCGIQMIEKMPQRGPRKAVATWEHIINDASIISRENIARCCVACNSSKGTKKLSDWLQSSYCKKRGLNKDTVAQVVKEAIDLSEKTGQNLYVQLARGSGGNKKGRDQEAAPDHVEAQAPRPVADLETDATDKLPHRRNVEGLQDL